MLFWSFFCPPLFFYLSSEESLYVCRLSHTCDILPLFYFRFVVSCVYARVRVFFLTYKYEHARISSAPAVCGT